MTRAVTSIVREEYLQQVVHELLHDPKVIRLVSGDLIRAVGLFCNNANDMDPLQSALQTVLRNNMDLRKQVLTIACESSTSGRAEVIYHGSVPNGKQG